MAYHSTPWIAKRSGSLMLAGLLCGGFIGGAGLSVRSAVRAQAPSTPLTTWAVTIVLPPKIVAGQLAMLATLGVDGRLASGMTVEVAGQRVTTDRNGRAAFTAPASGGYILAKASGASFAALVDLAPPGRTSQETVVAPAISLHDRFSICIPGLSGDAYTDILKINGQLALVLAASPECLVALPGPKAAPGPGAISVAAPGVQSTATTALVSLEFEPPNPPLLPEKKGQLAVRVQGSEQKLELVVENETPGVLRFQRGDAQEVVTSGGVPNVAWIKVQAVTSGDFSFHARMVPAPDVETARRYLEAAEPLAPKDLQHEIKEFAGRLAHHPRDFQTVASGLDEMLSRTMAGDYRTLLDAARAAL